MLRSSDSDQPKHIETAEELAALRAGLEDEELVLLCFHAGWCHNCPETERACAALATGFRVQYAEVNVADAEDLVSSFHIQKLPSVLLLDGKAEVHRMSGSHAQPDAVRDAVKQHCARRPLALDHNTDF